GQPFLKPAQPVLGHRWQEDQHFGQHHEQDRQQQKLGRQPARQRHLLIGALLPASIIKGRPHDGPAPETAVSPEKMSVQASSDLANRNLRQFCEELRLKSGAAQRQGTFSPATWKQLQQKCEAVLYPKLRLDKELARFRYLKKSEMH